MKLLLDANISWRLTQQLKSHFDDCIHVDKSELPTPARDIDIWNYALEKQFIIVTNDEDFLNLGVLKGFPPKVILLRIGNQSSQHVKDVLIKHKSEIESLATSEEHGLLELFDK